jgi:hypothetical protein
MKKTRIALYFVLCILVLYNIVGYGVRLFLEPKLLSAEAEYQLYIHLSSTVHDFPSANPVSLSVYFNSNVWDVDQGLRAAADDAKISSVLIHLDNVRLTVSQSEAIGEAIKYVRSKGKKVICYAASFDPFNGGVPAYLLASYCDVIQLQRLGYVALDRLIIDDIWDEDYVDTAEAELNKIDAAVNIMIRANRNSILNLKELPVNGKPNIDTQALNVGLIDAIVPRLTQSHYTIVVQDYVRLLETERAKRINRVAVVPIMGVIKEDVLKGMCTRLDIQAVVIHVDLRGNEKIGSIFEGSFPKPVVVYSPDLENESGRITTYQGTVVSVEKGSLREAIDTAIKVAKLNKGTVHIEIIHPGSWMSHIVKDLCRVGKSMVSMLKRSVNYVANMVFRAE